MLPMSSPDDIEEWFATRPRVKADLEGSTTPAATPAALFELAKHTRASTFENRTALANLLPVAIHSALDGHRRREKSSHFDRDVMTLLIPGLEQALHGDDFLTHAMHLAGRLSMALARASVKDLAHVDDPDKDVALAQTLAVALDRTLYVAKARSDARARDSARDIASDLYETLVGTATRNRDNSRLDAMQLMEWVAAIIYGLSVLTVIAVPPKDSEFLGEGLVIAPLVIVPVIDHDDVAALHHNIEQLLGELTMVAQDPATPPDLSLQATAHERDGHGLMYGADGQPRELPPGARTMYGWIIDAVGMIAEARPVKDADAARLLEQVTSSPGDEPRGLREALQTATTNSFAKDATERVRLGALDGVESGTKQLFERVIAHPVSAAASLTAFVTGVITMVRNYPWLEAGLRALLRLVTRAR